MSLHPGKGEAFVDENCRGVSLYPGTNASLLQLRLRLRLELGLGLLLLGLLVITIIPCT